MTILVTGTSGFIGKRLLRLGTDKYGDRVVAFRSQAIAGPEIVYRDLRSFDLTPRDYSEIEKVEVLVHAGAFTPKTVGESNQIIGSVNNILFTEQLLGLPWKALRKIVFLSTLDVYAHTTDLVRESTPTIPASLYGLSKLYCERMIEAFAEEGGMSSQILRIGHVYGPGEERYGKVIPRTIQNIVAGKDVELWGDGRELRSFIYVDDVVLAVLNAIDLVTQPGVINVVGGRTICVRDLLELLVALGGRSTNILKRDFSGKARDLVFDNAKLKYYLLGQETDFIQGLQEEFKHIENYARSHT